MQPIPEVSELSQRRAVDGSQLSVPEDGLHPARRDGTLRRTGSLRFANKVGHRSYALRRTGGVRLTNKVGHIGTLRVRVDRLETATRATILSRGRPQAVADGET